MQLSVPIVFLDRIMKRLLIVLFLNLAALAIPPLEAHKLVILISPPRGRSTAFLRMMRARGDFKILYEPGMSQWYHLGKPINSSSKKSFGPMKKKILDELQKGSIFIKELQYSALGYALDEEILKNPDTYYVFLLRDPHHVCLSYHSRQPYACNQWPYLLSSESLWTAYKIIETEGMRKPFLIDSDALAERAEEIVPQLCAYLGIPHIPESLHWEDLSENFQEKVEWGDTPEYKLNWHWNEQAITTTGFTPSLSHYKCDENGSPTFEEIKNTQLRAAWKKVYEESMPYYNQLLDKLAEQEQLMQPKIFSTGTNPDLN